MATGKVGATSFALYVDGYDLLGAKPTAFTSKAAGLFEPSTGLGDTVASQIPTGLLTVTITQAGAFFDDATLGMHALLSPAGATAVSRTLVAAFAGNTIGKPCLGASGLYASAYEAAPKVGALTKANVTYTVSGTYDRGVVLNAAVAKTVDWNTKTDGASVDYTLLPQPAIAITANTLANPTVVTTAVAHGLTTGDVIFIAGNITSNPAINGQQTVTVISATTFSVPVNCTTGGTGGTVVRANTSNGGAGYQVVSALSGFTGFVGKIRDSPDDITYGDLLTFTNVTAAPASERLTNVADTVVDRYLSFDGNVTGSGSITVFAMFARG